MQSNAGGTCSQRRHPKHALQRTAKKLLLLTSRSHSARCDEIAGSWGDRKCSRNVGKQPFARLRKSRKDSVTRDGRQIVSSGGIWISAVLNLRAPLPAC
jgi:hypothetical protein